MNVDPGGGILVEDVARAFGAVHAVRGASFVAAEGRVTGLVGPNGAGKTTLLLMLASLLAPDRGRIRIGGTDPVTDPSSARRVLGWMPDALGAWPSLTVCESIETTARLYDLGRDHARQRAEELIALVGLGDLAASPAKVLSRGQKQKLGLARALVHDPRVLLLDEPASGLDPLARVELRELLRRLAAEGRTILISSHVLSELEEVVDDTVFLVAGEVVPPPSPQARPWRIRTIGDPALPDDVDEAERVSGRVARALRIPRDAVGSDRGDLLVTFADERAAADGLAALVAGGFRVSAFAPAQSELEQSFLALGEGR